MIYMFSLSIDIGERNLGWTVCAIADSLEMSRFWSGRYDLTTHKKQTNVVLERVTAVHTFIDDIMSGKLIGQLIPSLKFVIIERQVPANEPAMCLMYAVASALYRYTNDIVIFDPKLKFSYVNQTYVTKNKAHKKQSVDNMRRICQHYRWNELEHELDDASKRDDIADSFNMMIVTLSSRGLITIDELKAIVNGH